MRVRSSHKRLLPSARRPIAGRVPIDPLILGCIAASIFGAAAPALAVYPGDLDGDGVVGENDEVLFASYYGGITGSPHYDPAADLDGDGEIGLRDLALLSVAFGEQGSVDMLAPSLFLTLNDIPDDMNDVLVVPPGGFQITVHFDSNGGSVVDPDSLRVFSLLDIGPEVTPLADISGFFDVTPTRAVFEVAPDPEIAQTTHILYASIANQSGNSVFKLFSFAIRDFALGAPLGSLQTVFLDFDQDRNLGPDIDFIESLREFGLSSASAPQIESQVRDLVVSEIVARTQAYFDENGDESPDDSPVNIEFSATVPAVPHSRMCVGGQSPAGSLFLGASPLDLHNAAKTSDECGLSATLGVFPHAIDNLWQSDPLYLAAFSPVDPSLGGIAVGDHPLDDELFFDPFVGSLTTEQTMRLLEVVNAIEAFAQTIASAIAHETGHTLGLSAPGPTPGGLYGGSSGAKQDHNVTPSGQTPSENYLMNVGNSFTFSEISGRGGPLPTFRTLSWAYLHDRVALNSQVDSLYLAPQLSGVSPNPLSFGGQTTTTFDLSGSNFTETITVKLFSGSPFPFLVSNTVVANTVTATSTINSLLVPPGVYDVEATNSDGQKVTMLAALEVVP